MTAVAYHTPGRLSIPLTQNTAPVFEFNCLYSQDVRRKHKRWKDGFLKYHTFNRRVLVYDIPRNFIGDTHWLGGDDLQEGDELKLEKGGALVQVADKIGQTETDLTELRKSKNRKAGSDGTSPSAHLKHSNVRTVATATATARRHLLPLQNKPLNAVLGTPRGPIGKATLPSKSPFDHRHEKTDGESWCEGRAAKRRRTATLPESARKSSGTDQHNQDRSDNENPMTAVSLSGLAAGLRNPKRPVQNSVVIDLCDEDVERPENIFLGVSSDALEAPSSPLRQIRRNGAVRSPSSSPFFQTQRKGVKGNDPELVPRQKHHKKRQSEPKESSRGRYENAILTGSKQLDHGRNSRMDSSDAPATDKADIQNDLPATSPKTSRQKAGKILRLPTTVPKKRMLLCQAPNERVPNQLSHTPAIQNLCAGRPEGSQTDHERSSKTVGETLDQRLQRIDRKRGSTSKHSLDVRKTPPAETECDPTIDDEFLHYMDDVGDSMQASPKDEKINKHERPTFDENSSTRPLSPQQDQLSSALPQINSQDADQVMGIAQICNPTENHAMEVESPGAATVAPPPEDSIAAAPSVDVEMDISPRDPEPSRDSGPPRESEPSPGPARFPRPIHDPEPAKPRTGSNIGFQRASAINMPVPVNATRTLTKPFQAHKPPPPPPKLETQPGLGPWSREAFDLFSWRPPKWDEEKWCVEA